MRTGTSQAGSINCPSCSGELIRGSGETHCHHCQTELPNQVRLLLANEDSSYHDTDPDGREVSEAEKHGLRIGDASFACPKCNELIDRESRFCKHCAFNLANPASSTRNRRGVIAAVVAGLVVVSLLVIGVIALVIIGLYASS